MLRLLNVNTMNTSRRKLFIIVHISLAKFVAANMDVIIGQNKNQAKLEQIMKLKVQQK